MVLYVFLALSAIFVSIFYLFYKKKFSYWKEKGVKGPAPWPIVGNFSDMMLQKESFQQWVKKVYLKYKEEKLVGLYRGFKPLILVRDPELIKHILIKDFSVFQDRGVNLNRSRLNDNLFTAEGEKWRIMRQKLTPLFTSRKLKDMTPIIKQCADSFLLYVDHLIDAKIDHEVRALAAKYTLEVIGSCAFGLDLHTFTDENNEFNTMAKKIFITTSKMRIISVLDIIIPGVRNMFNTSADIQEFFVSLVHKVIKEREGNPLKRKDFMGLLIELKEQRKVNTKLDNAVSEIEIDEYMLAAQALAFYSAGFEASSASMSFLFHELALNPNIQDRVYNEICQVLERHNGEINYDSVKDMKYLEMVFDETNRKYSVASILVRRSTADYIFPGTNVTIPKGMLVLISTSGLSADSQYFHNPDKFDPDNFTDEKLTSLPQCVYLPFGDGPRYCIGMRFAKVQSLLGSAAFLKKFKIGPSEKTKQELEIDPKLPILTAKGGIWLKISKR